LAILKVVIFYLVLMFITGSAVGSFLNVVIDRSVRGESILGRSYCENCRATLSTFDLVPILSFVGLRARCRYCRHKLSWQYPILETLTAVLFVFTFYFLATSGQFSLLALLYHLAIISVLIIVAAVDLKFSLIPTSPVFAASFASLFYNYFFVSSHEFVAGVLAAFLLAASFAGIVLITRGRGMGTGDIPLVFFLGLFLGWPLSLLAVFLSFLSGAAVAIALLLFRKKTFGQAIPFGPFLAGSAVVVFFRGTEIANLYASLF
jgi:leader peptidase (prepilin peptidase)/N-methyltransferase